MQHWLGSSCTHGEECLSLLVCIRGVLSKTRRHGPRTRALMDGPNCPPLSIVSVDSWEADVETILVPDVA
ncbi:hypothetical protein CDD81_4941 [Ophiocordyceps australis]|uniref:Uncharacterized protein n=1 Tax=Ophiocordyceps australis TaxID=1399860 RepID=A0A2C5YB55_9HYPO|nr:hypothetical protein CDD81_4941 [Ophiocordyceps australis]